MYSGAWYRYYLDEWHGGPTELTFDVDDTLPFALSDTSDLLVTGVLTFEVSDEFDIALADAAALAILTVRSASDSLRLRLADQQVGFLSLLARDDQLRVLLGEALETFVPLDVDDLLALGITEASFNAVVWNVADALDISFEDAASRVSVTIRIATAIRGTLGATQGGDRPSTDSPMRPSNPGKKRMN